MTHDVQVSNSGTIEDVKTTYLTCIGPEKVQEMGLTLEKIRLFAMGKELKSELFVYSYDLVDNMVIQAMFKK